MPVYHQQLRGSCSIFTKNSRRRILLNLPGMIGVQFAINFNWYLSSIAVELPAKSMAQCKTAASPVR